MATTQPNEQHKVLENHKREALNALIGEQVIHGLGQPHDLIKVWVRPLWENNYRVNILIGKDITSATISNSFFLAVDAEGRILTCNPKITKQYEGRQGGPA